MGLPNAYTPKIDWLLVTLSPPPPSATFTPERILVNTRTLPCLQGESKPKPGIDFFFGVFRRYDADLNKVRMVKNRGEKYN